ncbi:MAG: hypothetical protein HYX55_10700 [Chloroflexi bacterium]|nr:hypothetical protein [Chloroflexota bacterium]
MGVAAVSLDVRSSGLLFAFGVLGAAILVLLAAALVLGHPGWIGPVLGLLAALYLGHVLVAAEANVLTAGVVGVALLLVGELAQWSFDSRLRGRYLASMQATRAVAVGWLVLLGAGATFLSLLVVGLPVSGGLVTVMVGVVAFVGVVALVSVVARRQA